MTDDAIFRFRLKTGMANKLEDYWRKAFLSDPECQHWQLSDVITWIVETWLEGEEYINWKRSSKPRLTK